MNDLLNKVYAGNSLIIWIIAVGGILVGMAILKFIKGGMLRQLKRWANNTETTIDDFIVESFERSVIPILYILIVYVGLQYPVLPVKATNIIHVAMLLVCTFFILRLVNATIKFFVLGFLKQKDDGELKQKQARGLLVITRIIVWMLGMVFLLDNFGYDVTTIVAGLGIGGIAIALAAQAVLGDLFSYFVILFDRPFEIGDFIIVDDKMGVIEYVGIKTTRIKSITGEQLICANKDLTDSRVHNFKRMERRRVVLNIGVTYQTTANELESIPQIVEDIIKSKDEVVFDRGHFAAFGDFSLNFEFVYFILGADYNLYMDKQQAIALDIFRAFENKGIEFAYPTQTLFVDKGALTVDINNNGK
jgi:small-conductance mechanosensitive channel